MKRKEWRRQMAIVSSFGGRYGRMEQLVLFAYNRSPKPLARLKASMAASRLHELKTIYQLRQP